MQAFLAHFCHPICQPTTLYTTISPRKEPIARPESSHVWVCGRSLALTRQNWNLDMAVNLPFSPMWQYKDPAIGCSVIQSCILEGRRKSWYPGSTVYVACRLDGWGVTQLGWGSCAGPVRVWTIKLTYTFALNGLKRIFIFSQKAISLVVQIPQFQGSLCSLSPLKFIVPQ